MILKLNKLKDLTIVLQIFLAENTMEHSLSKIIKGIIMRSEGQELLLKGSSMIYDGLAIIDDAHEELNKLFPEKSLQNHPQIQTLDQ